MPGIWVYINFLICLHKATKATDLVLFWSQINPFVMLIHLIVLTPLYAFMFFLLLFIKREERIVVLNHMTNDTTENAGVVSICMIQAYCNVLKVPK